jgi:hypothetical protein
MKKLYYIFIILTLFSCEKDNISGGIETRVSGKLTDYYNIPITNAKMKVGEYKFKPNSVNGGFDSFQKWIDSSYTNQNGEYDFKFKTSGQGTSYKLFLENSPAETQQRYWSLLDPVSITNIGKSFNFSTNQLANLYNCDITITMNNLTVFPIFIEHDTTFNSATPEINSNATYIKRIYIIKYNAQTLNFYRTKPNGINQKAIFNFPASNLATLTTQNITLNDTDFVDL